MIDGLRLIRNVGQFLNEGSSNGAGSLTKGNLIFAENGRGKTTLASILRSYGTGVASYINERQRLGVNNPPHIVLACGLTQETKRFENGAWTGTLPSIVVFDDIFVEENVCSGLEVAPEHRKNLHEVVVGETGVRLARSYRRALDKSQDLSKAIRQQRELLQAAMTVKMSVDQFCVLDVPNDLDEQVGSTEQAIRAQENNLVIQARETLPHLPVTGVSVDRIEELLARDIAKLDQSCVTLVEAHIKRLGSQGRAWVESGLGYASLEKEAAQCPFCRQSLEGSPILSHYRGYFSQAYETLIKGLQGARDYLKSHHSEKQRLELRQAHNRLVEGVKFWKEYCRLQEVEVNIEGLEAAWLAATKAIETILEVKCQSPLEKVVLEGPNRETIETFVAMVGQLDAAHRTIDANNQIIANVKSAVKTGDLARLKSQLNRLQAAKERIQPQMAQLCADYIKLKAQKAEVDKARDRAKRNLDAYRVDVFPNFQTRVNLFLERLGAEFRLGSFQGKNSSQGASCNYAVIVRDTQVAVNANQSGTPAFRSLLSAGDRSTLAFAFFLAKIEMHPKKADLVVVIDDPMSSLDEVRRSMTVDEVKRLYSETRQLIVLSHSKTFLLEIQARLRSSPLSGLTLVRNSNGSGIQVWNLKEEQKTEHDHRYVRFVEYLRDGPADRNLRNLARDLRHHIEHYLRVARPDLLGAKDLLGDFLQNAWNVSPPFDPGGLADLEAMVVYANRFHHDTNPQAASAAVNDGELRHFVQWLVTFTSPL